MGLRTFIGLLVVAGLGLSVSNAQNMSGFWLGVTYPANPNQAVYNYTMTLTQMGTTLSGTAQTADPQLPFGGLAYIAGQVTGSSVKFSESDQQGNTAVKNICFWRGTMTYNPTEESLTGTYENIVNGTTCLDASNGKVELYRIVLKSGTTYCKGKPVNLVITGKNIRWYSSAAKTSVLATGNSFSPQITQTTTFYVTQTLYNNESPPVPVTVTLSEPAFKTTIVNTGCDKTSGSIEVIGAGTTGWQYKLNQGAFQTIPLFTGLSPGSYTVVAKDTGGCQTEQSVTVTADSAPTVSSVQSTPPRCETANGTVMMVATGGKPPLTYSINYGVSYQASPTFTNLPGGTYTVRVRDANGCEVNKALSLPGFTPITILNTTIIPTTCGQANGQVGVTVTGGRNPVQYSLDGRPFQARSFFIDLPLGSYTLVVKDSSGCTLSQPVRIDGSSGPRIDAIQTTPSACGEQTGTVRISTGSTTSALSYAIDGKTFQSGPDFSGLKDGSYTLTVRDDTNCELTRTISIVSDCANRIYLPTAFSPNHDGLNDALTVYFAIRSVQVTNFIVYDRWGAVLYNRANFALASGESLWDGQLNDQPVAAGMYSYRLDCQFLDGTQMTYRQSIALLH
ncbi:T9SS type B sorting domain-containing protein [Spirosoma fluviale]|uniref:Gliding motility-associated C-terminal domain-containing protein n=1 Tax=Spirosoma fluviale TaxID=1597977 RepID=A0A286F7Q5_9BACT|nr:gliding motility-associated C-terminal domain-containing protein [Spirosoma fluviale]SOD79257.1 gliding motility-associated C-terminal domain-containing protein [Spirosoma fluviale]